MDTRWNGFMQFRYIDDDIRAGEPHDRRGRQFGYFVAVQPVAAVSPVSASTARLGQEIDFANARPGTGTTINVSATVNPTEHLEFDARPEPAAG